ncbi:hypothetical protein [Candidatus Trichorickettsia mobilis]|uniref:hypothetical protein n=1 Tax=Candidatus Trichorickettsia mobilis TaxID=1346319 RepID=UPI00292F756C|nr:hypothetical protein [Candidatus Trichorickettsia mobilis]
MLAKNINFVEDNNAVLTVFGYDASKYNALKHGILSKYTVMHWENREDYDSLLSSLVREYNPNSTTEEHLVEELAGIIWRKMRLKYAEMSSLQSSLSRNVGRDSFGSNDSAKDALLARSYEIENFNIKEAILSSENETEDELRIAKECFEHCLVAIRILKETNSYENGLSALHEEDQTNWKNDWLNDEENDISSSTAEGLLSWTKDAKKYYEKRIYELENRSKIKQQILGKSFLTDKELDKYSRYESHLDRKFEKTLAMLIKLQEVREVKNLEKSVL